MIKSYNALIKDFLVRQMPAKAAMYAYWCLKATYETMMRKWWQTNSQQEYDDMIYLKLKNFYYDYKLLIDRLTPEAKAQIDKTNQTIAERKGAANYTIPFDEWLQNIVLRKDELNDKEIS